jgi:hypothetical protein
MDVRIGDRKATRFMPLSEGHTYEQSKEIITRVLPGPARFCRFRSLGSEFGLFQAQLAR